MWRYVEVESLGVGRFKTFPSAFAQLCPHEPQLSLAKARPEIAVLAARSRVITVRSSAPGTRRQWPVL